MALNAYLTLTGITSGDIDGSVTAVGKEDTIEIAGVKHMIHWPLDAVTGLPTITKKHKPITLIKSIDKSSPKLYTMMMTNEKITTWELKFYRPSESGPEEQFYTIDLQNAKISSIRFEQFNTLDQSTANLPQMEEVTFVYESITITYEPDGISAQDDWVMETS